MIDEQVTGVSSSQRQEQGAMPQNAQTSSREVIATENGLVNKERVTQIMR